MYIPTPYKIWLIFFQPWNNYSSVSFFMLWVQRNWSYCCWLLYYFFPILSHGKWYPMGKLNPSYIRVVKAFSVMLEMVLVKAWRNLWKAKGTEVHSNCNTLACVQMQMGYGIRWGRSCSLILVKQPNKQSIPQAIPSRQLELLMGEGVDWVHFRKWNFQENQTGDTSWFLESYILSYCMYMFISNVHVCGSITMYSLVRFDGIRFAMRQTCVVKSEGYKISEIL